MNRASMLIDAAIDGQGVALARTALVASDLINRRLVRPVDVSGPASSVDMTSTSLLERASRGVVRGWASVTACSPRCLDLVEIGPLLGLTRETKVGLLVQ